MNYELDLPLFAEGPPAALPHLIVDQQFLQVRIVPSEEKEARVDDVRCAWQDSISVREGCITRKASQRSIADLVGLGCE